MGAINAGMSEQVLKSRATDGASLRSPPKAWLLSSYILEKSPVYSLIIIGSATIAFLGMQLLLSIFNHYAVINTITRLYTKYSNSRKTDEKYIIYKQYIT